MMNILFTFLIIFLALIIMAIGVIFSNKELKGSCGGGLNNDCSCTAIEKKICKYNSSFSN